MIRGLRRRFIGVSMLAILIVLALIIGIIDIANYMNVDNMAKQRMDMLIANEGTFDAFKAGPMNPMEPPNMNGFPDNKILMETPFDSRYFTVYLKEDGTIASINMDNVAAISEETARTMAEEVLEKQRDSGYRSGFRYQKAAKASGETYYVFLDCSREFATFYSFLRASLIVSIIGAISYLILVLIFSKLVFRPVAESYEKQKRFITDASHEIKTPLAIIDANTEVIEMEKGESEWTKSIRNQVRRLSSLTEKLVFLSRMDEEGTRLEMREFGLSELVEEVLDSYDAMALSKGKTLERDIASDVRFYGDETNLHQMMSLLLDNAMKYSSEGGTIRVKMERLTKGKRRVQLTFYNTVESIAPGNHDELFERFYREDASRSTKTGGHGIGLSVVKAIVDAHHGKITAESVDGASFCITIRL